MALKTKRWRGGGQVSDYSSGFPGMNASFPFACLTVTPERLVLHIFPFGTYSFTPEQVLEISPFGSLPIFSQGIMIKHSVDTYPKRLGFFYLGYNINWLIHELAKYGYGTTTHLKHKGATTLSERTQEDVLLWEGQPEPKVYVTLKDIFIIPLCIIWLLEFLFMLYQGVYYSGVNIIFIIFMLVFTLVGFYFAIGRIFYKAYRKKFIHYYIYSSHVEIVDDKVRQKWSLAYEHIEKIVVKRQKRGFGTIVFNRNREGLFENTGLEYIGYMLVKTFAFFDIPRVDDVYKLLENAKNKIGK